MHTGRMLCEHEGRDRRDVFACQAMPKIAGQLPKLYMEHTFLGMEQILPLSSQKEPTPQALGFHISILPNCEPTG